MNRNLFFKLTTSIKILLCLSLIFFNSTPYLFSQSTGKKLIDEHITQFKNSKIAKPFSTSSQRAERANQVIHGQKEWLSLDLDFNKRVIQHQHDLLKMTIPVSGNPPLVLLLKKVDIQTESFTLNTASNKQNRLDANPGVFYWGAVEGKENSTVTVSIFQDELSGTIDTGEKTYTLGRLGQSDQYILYEETDLAEQPALACFTEDLKQEAERKINNNMHNTAYRNAENCLRMYLEIDHDLFLQFGSVAATYNYVAGAFSQVAILYANESINITINQILIWDTEDPYTGPSTSDYLNQFTAALNGNINGDLAHLIGTRGGGGIAHLNVLCANRNRTAYSGINTSYQDVPVYSWTVNVLTHEIGHNLGSPHTHNCYWNGNDTQIDDCGNQGSSNPASCYDANNPIIPQDGGTIMSYCHLTSVGINLNQGFGPQPGDLIRNNVYNAECLSPCEECTEFGNPCDDGNPCTINDAIDSYCNCTGIVVADKDQDGFCGANDPDDDDPCIPTPCTNCTLTTISITVDDYPSETSWVITDSNGQIVFNGAGYTSSPATQTATICIYDGCYDFVMQDSYGDGLCCQYGEGSYQVTDEQGNIIASGGTFGSSESTNFCYDKVTNSCTPGTSCDDNDNCTINDVYDADCNCAGIFQDSDNDGICDADDTCDAALAGTACDDNDSCTTNDVYDANCNCIGAFLDADNDGVCDADDVCDDFDDALIGTACDDGDVCTENDTYNGNCNCVGVFQDSDGDGICDANDTDDCSDVNKTFPNNPLTHSGTGSNSTTLSYTNSNQDVSFTISDISTKTNGPASRQYVEQVSVTYVDGNGTTQAYGTYSANNVSTVLVTIDGFVQSITVSLTDGTDGDSGNSSMSISLTDVTSCEYSTPPCIDLDGDGICDEDPNDCSNTTAFDSSELQHSDSGSTSTAISLTDQANPTFTISNLDAVESGNPSRRYTDVVEVSYIDETGSTIVYGTFSGANQSSVDIAIAGIVQGIMVSLSDGYDGNSPTISVTLSEVTSCDYTALQRSKSGDLVLEEFTTYPNPTMGNFVVSFDANKGHEYQVSIMDLLGQTHFTQTVKGKDEIVKLNIPTKTWKGGLYLVAIDNDKRRIQTKRVVVVKE